jgi:hypothetical protein
MNLWRSNWRLVVLLAPIGVAFVWVGTVFVLGWLRPVPTALLVPGTPDSVTVALYGPAPSGPGGDLSSWQPEQVVMVSDGRQIAKLVSDTNSLPLFPMGNFACPNDDGSHYQVQFSFGNGDRRTLFVDRQGCQGVGFEERPNLSIAWSLTDHRLLDDLDTLF